MKQCTQRQRSARQGWLLILPLLLGSLVFYGAPFFQVLLRTFQNGISRHFVGWSNYQYMLQSSAFRLAFGNTMKFLLVSIPLMLVLAFAVALLLRTQAKKHELLKSVLLLPYIMPVVGTVVVVQLLFAQQGWVNQAFYTLGLPIADWLHSRHAFWVMVMLYLWKNLGYAVILLLSGLATIPQEQYAVADLDGATAWQKIRCITIPQMWYSLFFTTVFSLINAFKCFREIFLIGGTHPDNSVYMLQHFINNSFDRLHYPHLAVASVLLLVTVGVVFALLYRWVVRKEAYKE